MIGKPNLRKYFVVVDEELDRTINPFGQPCTLDEAVEHVRREYSDKEERFQVYIVEIVMQTEDVGGEIVLNSISNK